MQLATISSKRQITISKDMLDHIGVSFNDKVLMTKDNNKIILTPVKTSVVKKVAGSLTKFVPKGKLGIPFSKVRSETQKKVAEYLALQNA